MKMTLPPMATRAWSHGRSVLMPIQVAPGSLTYSVPLGLSKRQRGQTLGAALSQIEDKVRAIPAALRYVKESSISNIVASGSTCRVSAAIVAANLYGKDEDGASGFTRACRSPSPPLSHPRSPLSVVPARTPL